jgi:tetratricopeptide (TPR) repeat protein
MAKMRYARAVIQHVMAACLVLPVAIESARAEATLFDNLGTLHHEITSTSDLAKKFFDQGLRLVYAFNHEEAIAAFTEASRLDPDAPMPYWGVALSLGPNINATMDPRMEPRAVEAVRKAAARLAQATPRERDYVEALAARYSTKKSATRKAKDEAYAKAMRRLARGYPDDVDAATLSAEAMMLLRPWDYWRADGRPQPGTEEIVATLEAALQQNPNHPGACHYYIHAVEASPDPKRGLECAKRLPSLMPGAGHLVHMPAHIYMRVGLYREASERNATAATVDHEYLAHHHLEGNYASGYYAHNLHFLNASLMMEGRSAEALQVARDLLTKISAEEIAKEPSLEWYAPTLLLTLARFGQWGDLIRQPPPPKGLRLTNGLWHYARGLAFAATTRFGSAEGELANLRKASKAFARAKTPEAKTSRTLLKIAERVLVGEMAARRGEYDAGIQALREALQLEATLPYSEPPFWFQPVRHNLGAVLLLAGHPSEAESVYREDLRLNPENGWALHGLVESLRAQNRDIAQEEVRFRTAWARADVALAGSRF